MIIGVLFSCNKNDDNYTENKFVGNWKLIQMTGSMPNSETPGTEMEWQETYRLQTDGTRGDSRLSGTTPDAESGKARHPLHRRLRAVPGDDRGLRRSGLGRGNPGVQGQEYLGANPDRSPGIYRLIRFQSVRVPVWRLARGLQAPARECGYHLGEQAEAARGGRNGDHE